MLTQSQFDVLYYLLKDGSSKNQRDISEAINCSLGKTNELISDLAISEYISIKDKNYLITKKGQKALEHYKVQNAIIMVKFLLNVK